MLHRIKRIMTHIPGAIWLKRKLFGNPPLVDPLRLIPVDLPENRGPVQAVDPEQLLNNYKKSTVSNEPNRFVLYRIIGNDLFPRHRIGQSQDNLRFILQNEPNLEDCEKRFVVNRIVNRKEEKKILKMLNEAGVTYIHIPFIREEYLQIGWDIKDTPPEYAPFSIGFSLLGENQQERVLMRAYRYKNNYVMNNNGARNMALREGRDIAKWVLPWDGNCFLNENSWNEITQALKAHPEIPYYLVPMARIIDNKKLLDKNYRPDAEEEPQIIFRRDASLEFNTEFFYGRRPKVELFWRLGVPGKWNSWKIEPWDLPLPEYSNQAGYFGFAGWVARLFSGDINLERGVTSLIDRGHARNKAIRTFLDALEDEESNKKVDPISIYCIDTDKSKIENAEKTLIDQLKNSAENALERGPYSVVDKKTLPPSKNRHDYWHPSPYYWPHPLRIPWLPYVYRDGRRVPGTNLYDPLSDRYDRTRLQRLFDDTFILSISYKKHGDTRYAEHAAKLIDCWFIDPNTAMTPHLEYAQVRKGHNEDRGSSSGIIEMKDLYYFLDAVRVLLREGIFDNQQQAELNLWFESYLNWLRKSSQGRQEKTSLNNHGTYYDLQVAAIAAFLGNYRLLRETFRNSRHRMLQQFAADGQQPEEMKRTMTAHYCCFNLQGWIHLAELAAAYNEDFWFFKGNDRRGIKQTMLWLFKNLGKEWPYQQINKFDCERFYPIVYTYLAHYGEPLGIDSNLVPSMFDIKPIFHPHDGIRPFWQLDQSIRLID